MRKAGFPCRVIGCDQVFAVVDQKSMDSLLAASAACAEHEVTVHAYHHVRLGDEPRKTYLRVRGAATTK